MFAPTQRDQLVNAALKGRADVIIALVAEGADIDHKNQACNLVLVLVCPILPDRISRIFFLGIFPRPISVKMSRL